MSRDCPILCFAGDNYWFSNPHSRYHLMHAVHRAGHRVLWVNSIGMNMPKVRQRGFVKRVALKLRSWLRWLKAAEPGFWVLTPIALPLFGNRAVERMNAAWIAWQVRLACLLLGMGRPLVFASIPSFADVVDAVPRRGLIYYYSDKYDAYRDLTARESIAAKDRHLFTAADAVFCASDKVHAALAGDRPHVHYLPHAVDFRHFHAAVEADAPAPADLAAVPRPRVGYYGSLTDSNDTDMILHAAREAPDLHFVLIGRVLGDYRALDALPNVHLLGFKPYAELPAYGRHFDVAFMAWKPTEWIRHSNPLKTKEYLSQGLPIVSIPIDELEERFGDLVEFAETGPEFLAAIRRCLADDSAERRAARIARVRGESWDARAAEMMDRWREVAHG
jgi:glycosyltransferase involved in cell wall biosynthesis